MKAASVATSQTITDGIKDRKLVLVAKEQADSIPNQADILQTTDIQNILVTSIQLDVASTAPVVRLP
jgi:hypothetical protein